MIYLTGDTHADLSRLKSAAARRLKSTDVLIICGDFGFIWSGSKKENKILRWIGKRAYRVLFIDGKHENYDLLRGYPESELYGGKVQQISGNLYHLYRGEIYEIEGKMLFAFGGGESAEKKFRIEEKCWWEEEMPTNAEMAHAMDKLKSVQYKVDYIVTHEAPTTAKGLHGGHRDSTNLLDSFFDEIGHQVTFSHWYFGSVHQDKPISQKLTALFESIVPASE